MQQNVPRGDPDMISIQEALDIAADDFSPSYQQQPPQAEPEPTWIPPSPQRPVQQSVMHIHHSPPPMPIQMQMPVPMFAQYPHPHPQHEERVDVRNDNVSLWDTVTYTLSDIKDVRLAAIVAVIVIFMLHVPLDTYVTSFLPAHVTGNDWFPTAAKAFAAAAAILVLRNWPGAPQ